MFVWLCYCFKSRWIGSDSDNWDFVSCLADLPDAWKSQVGYTYVAYISQVCLRGLYDLYNKQHPLFLES